MTQPDVLVLPSRYVGGWPDKDDDRAGLAPIEDILTERFDSDVHFAAYSAAVERRHTNASLSTPELATQAGIVMQLAVFDVDGPDHQADDEWWGDQHARIVDLLDEVPGGFVYRTRGGYRIVYRLPAPFHIDGSDSADAWAYCYDAWCNWLARLFGIHADRTCRTWTRLFRAPHVTRDDVMQEYETVGDPAALGEWSPVLDEADYPSVAPDAPAPDAPPTAPKAPRGAAVALLAAAWPPAGERMAARMALAGACAYSGLSRAGAVEVLERVHASLPDRGEADHAALEALVATTYTKHARGEAVSGWGVLAQHVGAPAARAARDLLEVDDDAAAFLLAQEEAVPGAGTAGTAGPSKGRGIFWDDWDEPLPPVEWLVEGLIPKGTVGGLVAHGSSLKTWTMLSIAAAVAQGKAWLGKYATKRGRVLIIDYESGQYELRRRMRILEGGKVVGLGAWSYPDKAADQEDFWKAVAAIEDVVLVCIDSLAAGTSPGVDENSTLAAEPLSKAAHYTELTGAAVMFVHHSKKDDSGDKRKVVRGSTAIYAAFDWCFAFEGIEETPAYRRMMMSSIKPCMGAMPAPIPLELTDAHGLTTFDAGSKPTRESPPDQIQAAILLALTGGPIESKAAIAKRVGLRKDLVSDEVDALVVRREVARLKGVGFVLESEEHQKQRVLETLREFQHWRSEAAIAQSAQVDTVFVGKCLREGWICKSADGRYLVSARQCVNGET